MESTCDVFLSHVEEDLVVVEEVARALDEKGYGTWYYERDAVAGEPYLETIAKVISECRAIVVVISATSLERGHQIDIEVFQAHEAEKRFFPLLRRVGFDDLKRRRPSWHAAMAGAVAIAIPPEGVPAVVPQLVRGLKAASIEPVVPVGESADALEHGIAKIRTWLSDSGAAESAERAIGDLLTRNPTSAEVVDHLRAGEIDEALAAAGRRGDSSDARGQLTDGLRETSAILPVLHNVIHVRIHPHSPAAAARLESALGLMEDSLARGERVTPDQVDAFAAEVARTMESMPEYAAGVPCGEGHLSPADDRYCPECGADKWSATA